jgi:hypothetical protein
MNDDEQTNDKRILKELSRSAHQQVEGKFCINDMHGRGGALIGIVGWRLAVANNGEVHVEL